MLLIVCLAYRHKASRKSRIVKSEKSDHLDRYVNRTEAWGPVNRVWWAKRRVGAPTQGKKPGFFDRSASKTGEERGWQKCQRTNSKSWPGDKQLKSVAIKGFKPSPSQRIRLPRSPFSGFDKVESGAGAIARIVSVNKSVIIVIRNFSTDLVRCITQS